MSSLLHAALKLKEAPHLSEYASCVYLFICTTRSTTSQVGVSGRGKAAQMRRQYRIINGARSLSKVPPELAPERPEMLGLRGGPAPREWVLVAKDELAELQVCRGSTSFV